VTTSTPIDPMAAAMGATEEPKDRTYFGEIVTADAWFVVLEKGVGKRLFDATRDDAGQRRTAIKIEIDPLRGEYLVGQECLHFEAAWLNCTLPSLKQHNIELGQLKGRYCQAKRVATGQTYVNKNGETKEKTGLVFVAFYETGADCIQAAEAFFKGRGAGSSNGNGGAVESAALPSDLGLPPEQAFALRSLPALWKASGNNATAFKTMIEQNPLISKYYPWDHAHVQGLVSGTADDLFPERDPSLPF
jgi:hypothetical protein